MAANPMNTLVRLCGRWLFFLTVALVPSKQATGAVFQDGFSGGIAQWFLQGSWTLVERADGQTVLRGDGTGDGFARHRTVRLGSSWRVEVDVRFHRYYSDGNVRALAAFALFPALDSGVQLEANLQHRTNSSVQFDAQWFNPSNATWRNVLQTSWSPNPSSTYRLHLYRAPGSDRLVFKVSGTNGAEFIARSLAVPVDVLDRMQVPGLRVNSGQIEFDNFRLESPYQPPVAPEFRSQPQAITVLTGTEHGLSAEATDVRPVSYQWLKGTAPIAGATNATLALGRAVPAHSGNYSVQVSNGESLAFSQVAAVKVIDAWLRLASSVRTNGIPADSVPMEVRAPAGVTYAIQHSSEFVGWTNLLQTTGTGLLEPVAFPRDGAQPTGLFRLVVP